MFALHIFLNTKDTRQQLTEQFLKLIQQDAATKMWSLHMIARNQGKENCNLEIMF